MGSIKKVLGKAVLEPRCLTANGLWVDLCENIHIHYRNIRLDMSMKEFAEFMGAMRVLYKAAEYAMDKYDFEEGDPNILKQLSYTVPLASSSDYYPNRLVIEANRDNTYHIHYRDLRIHLTKDEFEDFANAFVEAKQKNDGLKDFKYKDIKEPIRVTIPIDDIQPYDEGHRPMVFDKPHRDGIEYVKKLIQEGKKIRPILVDTRGQRMDGFKRYMAFKELGYKEIDCIVDPYAVMGGQHGADFIDDELLQKDED